MTFYLCNLQQPTPDRIDLRRSSLDIERLEIMCAVREAQLLAEAERRDAKRLRRDIRRLERVSPVQRLRQLWHSITPA